MRNYVLELKFTDGCIFLMHGKDYKSGWGLWADGKGVAWVECPHGRKAIIIAPKKGEPEDNDEDTN